MGERAAPRPLRSGSRAILAKIGIRHTPSNLATAIRTAVVLVFAWVVMFLVGSQGTIGHLSAKTLVFLFLSGVATGASWLCYYHALQLGPASLVVPIDKLSIVVTVAFATWVLHERLTRRAALGLVLLVGGTLLMLV